MADDAGSRRHQELLQMTTDVVSAYVAKNALPASQVAEVIGAVYGSLKAQGSVTPEPTIAAQVPAVPIKKSVTADYLISLEDGKKLKMLKRYLRTAHNMTPEQYRTKWKLPADYPMVAPNYAAARSDFAKKIGLGRKPGQSAPRRSRSK